MSSFTHIRTSKDNHARVVELTRKLGFGAENVTGRIALATSLATGNFMELGYIQNSAGKEYRTTVLFGKYVETYVSIVANKYNLHRTNRDVAKLLKMHLDDGIEHLHRISIEHHSLEPIEGVLQGIDKGLNQISNKP